MNQKKACSLLGIKECDLTPQLLKKQYRRKCLLVHPDKKGNTQKFIELKEAYDFLSQSKPSWLEEFDVHFLRQYLVTVYQIPLCNHPLFVKHFIEPVRNHVDQYKTYILRPTLDHLFQASIYYLEEEHLYVPLWHHEIVFHGKIKVLIYPELPNSIEIDDQNDLLLETIGERVTVGSISILTSEQERKEQKIIGKGIPLIGDHLYDCSIRGDLKTRLSSPSAS